MKKDYSHIVVILDRSGSMESIRNDIIGGFNTFIQEQQKLPGTATLTLVQFDDVDPYEVVHDFTHLKQVPILTRDTYIPRSCTPLLDAIGRGINDCGKRLSDMPEPERPENVIFVIITDGQENSSKEFKKHQISKMIDEQREVYKWKFVFLSSDMNAIQDAAAYGIDPGQTFSYDKTSQGTQAMYSLATRSVAQFRAPKPK